MPKKISPTLTKQTLLQFLLKTKNKTKQNLNNNFEI